MAYVRIRTYTPALWPEKEEEVCDKLHCLHEHGCSVHTAAHTVVGHIMIRTNQHALQGQV